jgi:hypothetical protein
MLSLQQHQSLSNCPIDHHGTAATGTTLLQYGFMFAQHRTSDIDPTWIVLDSQSAILVFNNPDMLTNIRPSGRVLRAVTNGGHQGSNFVGDFHNHGEVWFYHASIASILALAYVRKVCRVIMDTYDEAAMIVHRLDGSEMNSRNMPVVVCIHISY